MNIIIGGDPELMRKHGIELTPDTAEVPCQKCGRLVLLTEEAQRLALGDPVKVVAMRVTRVTGDLTLERTGEPPETNRETATVLCVWCAFEGNLEVLAKLGLSK
jgi:hypothetical protein